MARLVNEIPLTAWRVSLANGRRTVPGNRSRRFRVRFLAFLAGRGKSNQRGGNTTDQQ